MLAWNTQDHCLSIFIALVYSVCGSHRLPDGRKLLTLKDAADYIMKLPKKESDLQWQMAIEALMLCSRGGDPMLARIGVLKALLSNMRFLIEPASVPELTRDAGAVSHSEAGDQARQMLKGACLVEGHALHLAGKNSYSSCDGEPATAQSLRASERIKNTGRIFILPDRN